MAVQLLGGVESEVAEADLVARVHSTGVKEADAFQAR